MRRGILGVCAFLFLIGFKACKEPYAAPILSNNNSVLVIEGFLAMNGVTTFKLTRSVEISSQFNSKNELGAVLTIESDGHQNYPLTEQGNGIYQRTQAGYPMEQRYRIKIVTKDGTVYYSEYVTPRKTPGIDKLFWERNNDGVGIYLNTSDPANETKYYRWEWEETWKFHMDLKAELYIPYRDSAFVWSVDSLPEYPYKTMCWQSEKSSQVLIETSERLSQDVIAKKAITFISKGAWKLSDQYSILVKQYAINKESYQFWENILKNSSGLGSVYSPMPSEIMGNYYCSTDPKLKIIGFFEAASQTEKRIFINSDADLINWGYDDVCIVRSIPNQGDSIRTHIIQAGMVPYRFVNDKEERLYYVSPRCVDCTLRGTSVKPDFWP